MSINVNGVTLPDIPADVLAEYPYCSIFTVGDAGIGLFATQSEQMILPDGVYETTAIATKTIGGYTLYGAEDGGTEWTPLDQTDEFGAFVMDVSIVWANHDIMRAVLDTESATFVPGTEIYFPSSVVAEPEYGKIKRQIMRGIANAIRRKTGGTDKIPPEQMESEIDSVVTADNLPRRLIQKIICGEYYGPEVEVVEPDIFGLSVALTSLNLPNVKHLGGSVVRECANLSEVTAPNLETMGGEVFYGCPKLRHICFPKLKSMGIRGFAKCLSLAKADFSSLTTIGQYAFLSDAALTTLIFRMGNILPFATGAINGTPIASGSGYIYVPSSLVSSYKTATGWSTYSAQFRAIEDYPDICGG